MSETKTDNGVGIWLVGTERGLQLVEVTARAINRATLIGPEIESIEYRAVAVGSDLFGSNRGEQDVGLGDTARLAVLDLAVGGPDRDHEMWPVIEIIPPGEVQREVVARRAAETLRMAVEADLEARRVESEILTEPYGVRGSYPWAVASRAATAAAKSTHEALVAVLKELL